MVRRTPSRRETGWSRRVLCRVNVHVVVHEHVEDPIRRDRYLAAHEVVCKQPQRAEKQVRRNGRCGCSPLLVSVFAVGRYVGELNLLAIGAKDPIKGQGNLPAVAVAAGPFDRRHRRLTVGPLGDHHKAVDVHLLGDHDADDVADVGRGRGYRLRQ
jgi:hypothetical protein